MVALHAVEGHRRPRKRAPPRAPAPRGPGRLSESVWKSAPVQKRARTAARCRTRRARSRPASRLGPTYSVRGPEGAGVLGVPHLEITLLSWESWQLAAAPRPVAAFSNAIFEHPGRSRRRRETAVGATAIQLRERRHTHCYSNEVIWLNLPEEQADLKD